MNTSLTPARLGFSATDTTTASLPQLHLARIYLQQESRWTEHNALVQFLDTHEPRTLVHSQVMEKPYVVGR